jgi:hypothetical protein
MTTTPDPSAAEAAGADPGADLIWRDLARASRDALAELGYHLGPQCLPDEPEACGGTFAEHSIAHLASIKAVADHHLLHLGPPVNMISSIYMNIAGEVDCGKTCPHLGQTR